MVTSSISLVIAVVAVVAPALTSSSSLFVPVYAQITPPPPPAITPQEQERKVEHIHFSEDGTGWIEFTNSSDFVDELVRFRHNMTQANG